MVSLASAHDTETAKIVASDGAAGDHFGFSVAFDRNTMLVGAPTADNPGADSGAAYVFVVSGTTWVQQAKLNPSEAFLGDQYGFAVAVTGDVIVVGAPFHDDNGADSGTLFIWERSGAVWTESAKINASDGQAGDQFGKSVSVSGTTVFAGAPGGDKVHVITKSGAVWSESSILAGSDTVPGDNFGHDVALEEGRAVIASPLHDELGTDSGAVYLFERVGTTWVEGVKLEPSDGATGDLFGLSVALSGSKLFVGAPFADLTSAADAGAAYEFQRTPAWSEVRKYVHLAPSANDRFGNSVAITNGKLLTGVRLDDQAAANSGSAFEFFCFPAPPLPLAGCLEVLVASDAGTNDQLGISISGAGCWYSVGAHFDDDNGVDAGAVYTYLLPRETSFCTAKTNVCGGTPALSHTGMASASATSGFTITASGAKENTPGFVMYTNNGRREPAFPLVPSGFVCLNQWRTASVFSSAGTPGQCNATFSIDMNAFSAGALGGNPAPYLLVPGTVIDVQFWAPDDSSDRGIYITNAFEYTVCP